MLTFAEIASAFLRELGYEPDECSSEQEAREKAARLKEGDRLYPVYYFNSDTSGEKSFEEFYTDVEEIDWNRFHQLGVICNAPRKSMSEITGMFDHLNALFARPTLDKQAIVRLMQEFIPNFEHIETGKGLDSKM
jgi:hypothetical protein